MNAFNLGEARQIQNVSDLETSEECENDLQLNYKTPGHPIAFSGITNIYNYYKRKISQRKIKEILSTIESYTLHKGYRSAQRNPTYSHFKRYMFQMDLLDFQQLARYNDGTKYLITVIDTFTRYAFVRPLEDKSGLKVLHEFKSIIEEAGEKPKNISMDRG